MSWATRRARLLVASACLLSAVGCDAEIVGEWKSPDASSWWNGSYLPNRLTIGSDGTGKADVYYAWTDAPSQDVHLDRFEVSWEEVGDYSYELAMSCFELDPDATSIAQHDFTMSCDATSSPDRTQAASLACTGDGAWVDYGFGWEAVIDEQ